MSEYIQVYIGICLANKMVAALQSLLVVPRSPRPSSLRVKNEGAPADNTTEPKREVSASTSVKGESRLKHEHSIVAVGDEDKVVFVSATKQRKLKEEPGLKRKHSAGDGNDEDLVFISATKRRRSNITVTKNGAEVIDLT